MSCIEVTHSTLTARDDVPVETAILDALKFAASKSKAVELNHKGKKYVIDLDKYVASLIGK